MVDLIFHPSFKKAFLKIKDKALKEKIFKQFAKLGDNPEIGKPMRYTRKGTREIRIPPFRLSYLYLGARDEIILLDIYHKDEQ